MNFIGRPLKRLSNKEILYDIKKYIKNSHEFYKYKTPELDVMAKKIHDEYSLKEFYRIFNRLWNGYRRSLAIHSLALYNEDFDLDTWRFIKTKLKDINSIDEVKYIAEIISLICLMYSSIKNEILGMSSSSNVWIKRISVFSYYYLIKRTKENFEKIGAPKFSKKNFAKISLGIQIPNPSTLKKIEVFGNRNYAKFSKINGYISLKIIKENIHDSDKEVQKALMLIIKEIGKYKKEEIKKLILKHKDMPENLFLELTRNMKYLRKLRKIHKL